MGWLGKMTGNGKESYRNRAQIVSDYFHVSTRRIHQLSEFTDDKILRKYTATEYGIDPYILRTMMDYTRYMESELVTRALQEFNVAMKQLSILDFGCSVSDYGIFFARLGADVTAYDYQKYIDFVRFRFERENLKVHTVTIPSDYSQLLRGKDLVIFGEVLEHMEHPFTILKTCAGLKTKYIFTSHYPYGTENYFNISGHTKSAEAEQTKSLEFLKENYSEVVLESKKRLWILRNGTSHNGATKRFNT